MCSGAPCASLEMPQLLFKPSPSFLGIPCAGAVAINIFRMKKPPQHPEACDHPVTLLDAWGQRLRTPDS